MSFALYTFLWLVFATLVVAAVYALAKKEILFTFCKEGEIIVVVEGESYRKLIHSVDGWTYNEEEKIFKETPGTKAPQGFFGIHFIGPPFITKILKWEFTWNKWAKPAGKTEYEIVPKTDLVSSLIFQFPYAIRVTGIEIQGQIKIDIELLATLRTVSPYNALFRTGRKWLDPVVGKIYATSKETVGQYDIDRVRKMKSGGQDMEDFKTAILSLTESLTQLAGQQIVGIDLLRFDQEEDEEARKATQALELARLKGEGLVETARKQAEAAVLEAEKIRTIAQAKREELESTVVFVSGGPGPNAVEALKWQKIAESDHLSTYVEGGRAGVNINTEPPKSK